jgi:hypothetical protein
MIIFFEFFEIFRKTDLNFLNFSKKYIFEIFRNFSKKTTLLPSLWSRGVSTLVNKSPIIPSPLIGVLATSQIARRTHPWPSVTSLRTWGKYISMVLNNCPRSATWSRRLRRFLPLKMLNQKLVLFRGWLHKMWLKLAKIDQKWNFSIFFLSSYFWM